MKTEAQEIQQLLAGKNKVLVITHYNPDGDAIGSAMALHHYLAKKGFDVKSMVPNEFPDFLKWIPGATDIVVYLNNPQAAIGIIKQAEAIVCVDFNDPTRLKEMGVHVANAKCIKFLIDHHPNPSTIFNVKISDTSAAATAQLIFRFIEANGDLGLLDKTIAECIFIGITTDTGNFSHNCSGPELYLIVAELMRHNIDKDKIFNNLFNNFSEKRMRLMGYCLNDKMVLMPGLHTAYIYLTIEEQIKFNFQPGDSEGFVNLPFSIKGIIICALFIEKKDHVRISLRSRGTFAVNKISEEHFEGGGHKNAAGGESKLTLKETLQKFELIIKLQKDEILQAAALA